MKQWVKFSTDVHSDIKMWKLSKNAQLTFFYLLSIAGKEDKGGILPPLEDISIALWFLKFSKNTLKSTIDELINSGIIESESDGILRLKNFEKWQKSEKSKSEINHDYYLKSKIKKSEIQTEKKSEFRLDSDLIQTEAESEFRKNSDVEKNRKEKNRKELEQKREEEKREEKEREKKTVVADATHTHKRARGELKPFGTAQNVFLSEDEYQKLIADFGQRADEVIDELSLYMAESEKNAKKYTDHYFTVLKWAKKDNGTAYQQRPLPKKTYTFSEVFDMYNMGDDSQNDSEVIDL